MHLSYNAVEFKVLTITDYLRQQVFTDDGTTFLFDHITIRCLSWINPAALFAEFNIPIGDGKSLSKKRSAASTAEFIVSRLVEPRRELKIWINCDEDDPTEKQYVLISPSFGRQSDARFGPFCNVISINPNHGNGSLVFDLEFTTDVLPTDDVTKKPGGDLRTFPQVVLANRWSYRIAYDSETYAEQRIIDGAAHIHIGNLLALPHELALPDLFRVKLVPPVIKGYKREAPVFELDSGGDVLRYVIVDTQMQLNNPYANFFDVANIRVEERRKLSTLGFWSEGKESGMFGRSIEPILSKRREEMRRLEREINPEFMPGPPEKGD